MTYFKLRLKDEIHTTITKLSEANKRSIHAEYLARIEESLLLNDGPIADKLDHIRLELAEIKKLIEKQNKQT